MSPKVILAEHSGFCFGVKRAISLAEEALCSDISPVFSLGHIIHNPLEVSRLKSKGLRDVQDLSGVDSGIIIIRSHGAHPRVFREAESRGLKIVDATCPFVRRLHKIVGLLREEGYRVIAVGEADHPEVKALSGVEVVESAEDAVKAGNHNKIGLVSQTTQSAENFGEVVSVLAEKAKELRIFRTICSATEKRQAAASNLSAEVDLMVVVGGYNSANTRRLKEICLSRGTRTIHIESEEELEPEKISKLGTVGVTAGASTPGWIVERVIRKLEELP